MEGISETVLAKLTALGKAIGVLRSPVVSGFWHTDSSHS